MSLRRLVCIQSGEQIVIKRTVRVEGGLHLIQKVVIIESARAADHDRADRGHQCDREDHEDQNDLIMQIFIHRVLFSVILWECNSPWNAW